jgi:uncharacterized tellurite resistance protein B-like protein
MSHEDRLRLMKFVCSLAWADLEVRPKERAFVKKMVKRLHLDEAEAKLVDEYLKVPPPAEEVDPARVPHKHRKVFLDAVKKMAEADGEIDAEEKESLALLEQLLT